MLKNNISKVQQFLGRVNQNTFQLFHISYIPLDSENYNYNSTAI